MLELLIVPVCFVIFVSYLMCSMYYEQQKYYKCHHPTEKDLNDSDSEIDDEQNEPETEEPEK